MKVCDKISLETILEVIIGSWVCFQIRIHFWLTVTEASEKKADAVHGLIGNNSQADALQRTEGCDVYTADFVHC